MTIILHYYRKRNSFPVQKCIGCIVLLIGGNFSASAMFVEASKIVFFNIGIYYEEH